MDGTRVTPEGWHTLSPRIVVHEVQHLVEFIKYVVQGDRRVSARVKHTAEEKCLKPSVPRLTALAWACGIEFAQNKCKPPAD